MYMCERQKEKEEEKEGRRERKRVKWIERKGECMPEKE